jgi:16S rRNA (adenine1518-N6/adenine1519-N6)-dimethyltransferase
VSDAPLSRSQTIGRLKKHGLFLKKSLGQNFLVDPGVLERILEAVDPGPEDGVLEVGPGIGAMTRALAERAGAVTALEFDPRFLPALEESLAGAPPVRTVHGDVLKADLRAMLLEMEAKTRKVAANLPYYITSPALIRFLEMRDLLERIVVLVQKEVADRLTAAAGSKDYGSLSVLAQYHAETRVASYVPNSAFLPPPKVSSAIVLLKIRDRPPVEVPDEALFFRVARAAFGQRRKTLLNALAGGLHEEKDRVQSVLRQAGVDPGERGENLGLEDYAAITRKLHGIIHG